MPNDNLPQGTDAQEDAATVTTPDELTVLKERASLMGISFHPSIGLDKLREKVNEAVTSTGTPDTSEPEEVVVQEDKPESDYQRRVRLIKEANELVRVRVTCMNPAKKEWDGELFTVGNRTVGTFKKFVPFNAEEGWHVPRIILQQIQERKCQIFITVRNDKGNKVREGKMIKEFSVEILPALSVEELNDLATRQAVAN